MFVTESHRTKSNRIAKRRSRLNRMPISVNSSRLANAICHSGHHPQEQQPQQQQNNNNHGNDTAPVEPDHHEAIAGTMAEVAVVNGPPSLLLQDIAEHGPVMSSSSLPEGNTASTFTDATYLSTYLESAGSGGRFTASSHTDHRQQLIEPQLEHQLATPFSPDSADSVTPSSVCVSSPLLVACMHGSLAAVKVLVEHGAKLDAISDFPCSAMHIAAERGHVAILQLLARHGASVFWTDLAGDTPVHRAAKAGQEEAVRVLADMGANLNARNCTGWTALHYAARVDNASMLELLISLGVPAT